MDKDIEKMQGVFVTKPEFQEIILTLITKTEFHETTAALAAKQDLLQQVVEEKFSKLLTSIDTYAKKVDDYAQETIILGHQTDRNTKHIDQIAHTLDLTLK